MISGGQYVMTCGAIQMLQLFANSRDSSRKVFSMLHRLHKSSLQFHPCVLHDTKELPHTNAYYGPGSGAIHLDTVQCTGDEDVLLECPSSAIGSMNCNHGNDVGVRCQGNNNLMNIQNTF